MIHKEFLVDMRVGDIGLSGGNAFIQKAIRFFTNSQWSHSFTVVPSLMGINALAVMETTESRNVVVPLSRKLNEPDWVFVYRPRVSQAAIANAIGRAWNECSGELYGYTSYLWFIWAWVVQKFGRKAPENVWKWAQAGITCTEYTTCYVKYLGPQYEALIGDEDRSEWNPQKLQETMDANPELFEKIGWAVKP